MEKLILTSILISTFVIPAVLHRQHDDEGDQDYVLVLKPLAGFVAVYVLLLLYVYPRFL